MFIHTTGHAPRAASSVHPLRHERRPTSRRSAPEALTLRPMSHAPAPGLGRAISRPRPTDARPVLRVWRRWLLIIRLAIGT